MTAYISVMADKSRAFVQYYYNMLFNRPYLPESRSQLNRWDCRVDIHRPNAQQTASRIAPIHDTLQCFVYSLCAFTLTSPGVPNQGEFPQ